MKALLVVLFSALAAPVLAEGSLEIASRQLAMAEAAAGEPAIAAFYRTHDYEAIWTDDAADDAARRVALVTALAAAGDHGLPEGRYPVGEVRALLAQVSDERALAEAEVGLSRIFLSYARDVKHGVLVPSEVDPGIVRKVPYDDPEATLRGLAEAADPAVFLAALPPQSPEYVRLMKERLRLADIVAGRGWGSEVPTGASLRPGESGGAVVALRDRLVRMGYLAPTASADYDGALQTAVQTFQADHGLTADGIAGPDTLSAVNVAPETRLEQVLVAMERERWTNMPRGERHVWVNLTDFSVKIVDDGKVTFRTKAVVGMNQSDRRSPEFSDMMEHLVVNPTWNVPRSIAINEYLPEFKRNPYANGHLTIYYKGAPVPRDRINWAVVTAANWPFQLKELPSDGNALGKVKFMFPNRWNIYLHDTPSKGLFDREVRAFSHGCIRLADPFDFAYALLSRQTDDPVGLFQSKLRTGRETVVPLAEPVPVHLVYRTAIAPAKGRVNYRRDIYGRDARIWDALAEAGVAPVPLQG